MALTRVRSEVVSNYIQPAIGDTVQVVISTDIDWIRVGTNIYVEGGGVYEVVSIVGNVHTIKLIKGEAPESSQVLAKVVFPTDANSGAGGASKAYVVQVLGMVSEPIGADTDYIICYGVDVDIDIPDPANHPGRVIKITNLSGAGYNNFIGYPLKTHGKPSDDITQLGGWYTANPELTIPRSVEIISVYESNFGICEWVVVNLGYGSYDYYFPDDPYEE